MPSPIAVLSDVHGVLPPLDAVLAEPEVLAAELIVVIGDLVAGPRPGQVLDRLAEFGSRALLVRGNADRELVSMARGELDDAGDPVARWAADQLSPAHVAQLAALPDPVTVEVPGFAV